MTLAPAPPGRATGRHAARHPGPPGRRRHGPSRQVRLRRTLAAALAVVALVVAGLEIHRALTGWTGESTTADAAVSHPLPTDLAEEWSADAAAQSDSAARLADRTAIPSGPATAVPSPAASSAPVVVQAGNGTIEPVALPSGVAWTEAASGRVVRFALGAEGGLGVDTGDFARRVLATLADERGWQGEDRVRFRYVSADEVAAGAKADVTIVLASPDFTDWLCAPLTTGGEVSCHAGGRAVINAKRWQLAVPWFNGDLDLYRQYVVNHEVGHALGHGHATCRGTGRHSPVMAQQTFGLDGCVPWAWPADDGA